THRAMIYYNNTRRTALACGLFSFLVLSGCIQVQPTMPGVAYATISVKCGGDTYTVSTGTNSGKCETTEGPGGHGAACTGGGGRHGASMVCTNGVGRCLETEGAGSCTVKSD